MTSAARQVQRRSGWRLDPDWQTALDGKIPWPGDLPKPTCWRKGPLAAIVGYEPIGDPTPRWHISVQHRDRVPTWQEMTEAAHQLRPGVVFVIGVPPRSWWINVHERVLHLWELRDLHLITQWRFEGRGDEPS